ncbi:hypothetical protein TR51_06710 [Kitasatospora griseola]|uniref:Uncharacterized protein n=1 Tax=Kitasatospora griseola TaxID=2064 RepID=A0A0D0NFI2_KITGR|nr:hypothetical protein [Kitasatospora griseola]KIQ67065.1 hypothetical protein TR51_06710 [Kitasatospora griseola]
MPKIFGREPALWLALVATLVKLVGAFWVHLSDEQQALINALAAAIVGLIVARIVHDGMSAALLGFAQGALALAVGFGLHMAADRQATIMSAVGIAVAMFVRTQATAPVPAVRQLPPIPPEAP